MIDKKLILSNGISDNLLARLENRDVALWIREFPVSQFEIEKLLAFLGLPWLMVMSEISEPVLIKALEEPSKTNDYMTRKRGFVQIVDSDPSRVQFPQRCLPIYLLNGREGSSKSAGFEDQLRRITMLEGLRRSLAREILVISGSCDLIPPGIDQLWASGFRSDLTFVSDCDNAHETLNEWVQKTGGVVGFTRLGTTEVVDNLLQRYLYSYPDDRKVIRVRDHRGNIHKVDITEIDDPEKPILDQFTLVTDRELSPLQPEELSEKDFISFFQNPNSSWRPYAAGLPWNRVSIWTEKIDRCLKNLDFNGSDDNRVASVVSG